MHCYDVSSPIILIQIKDVFLQYTLLVSGSGIPQQVHRFIYAPCLMKMCCNGYEERHIQLFLYWYIT